MPILTTPRLRLRPYTPADRAWFCDVFSDPVVMRHLDGAMPRAAAAALFDGILDGSRERVFAAWCAERTSGPAGIVGHGALLREGVDLELGYVLPRPWWGRGYATEIAKALTEHALGPLGRERLIATVDADHPPSRRVLEKVGMREIQRVADPEGDWLVYATSPRTDDALAAP